MLCGRQSHISPKSGYQCTPICLGKGKACTNECVPVTIPVFYSALIAIPKDKYEVHVNGLCPLDFQRFVGG